VTAHVGRRSKEQKVAKTAQQAASNWSGSGPRAVTEWQTGVQNYSGDWAGATTRQQAAMQQNWNQSVQDGTWARGVQSVGTSGWKQATQDKVTNYSTGFQAGATNYAASAQKIFQANANILPNLPPRGSYEQNKIRSTTYMDAMHAQRGQLGAR
jgi:hypothetical protein